MVAINTNILVYAEGLGEIPKQEVARKILDCIPRKELIIPAQVLAELYRVLVSKAKLSGVDAGQRLACWESFALVTPTLSTTVTSAVELATQHRLQIFDAVILASAGEAGCRMLVSEDMQDGFVWQGVTVVNPWASTVHPMLADLLGR